MPAKPKSTKRRTKTEDTPKRLEKLTTAHQKLRGGLLPYIEQDNLYKATNIKDGTSNTLLNKK